MFIFITFLLARLTIRIAIVRFNYRKNCCSTAAARIGDSIGMARNVIIKSRGRSAQTLARVPCDVAISFPPQNFIRQARRTTNHNYSPPYVFQCARGATLVNVHHRQNSIFANYSSTLVPRPDPSRVDRPREHNKSFLSSFRRPRAFVCAPFPPRTR